MNALLFVLLFVGLGLGVFVIALTRGRGSATPSQSRGSRKGSLFVLFVALAGLGVAVPAAVIAAVHDRNDSPAGGLHSLTANEKRGQKLFGQRCAACHTLAASNAVAQVGPNLDDLQPNAALVKATIKNGQSNGGGQMPAGIYQGQDAQDVAAYVALATGAAQQ
jgi:mono/diheme cytochrome c family protein